MKWKDKVLEGLEKIANLPEDWDGEGSPKIDPKLLGSVRSLLWQVAGADVPELQNLFVVPISGGGFQIEWDSDKKHLEISFGDNIHAMFLTEETVDEKVQMVSGEFDSDNRNALVWLLRWFVS